MLHPQPVVAPRPLRSATEPLATSAALSPYRAQKTRFDGGEHTLIGDQIRLRFANGEVAAASQPLCRAEASSSAGPLRYGQVLALGADFYGVPGRPIASDGDPEAAFRAAYDSFTHAADGEIEAVLAIMRDETDALSQAARAGKAASTVHDALADTLALAWNQITRGRYQGLATLNWDHFETCARTAYAAGHRVAMKQAVRAARAATPSQQHQGLELAYAMNAFADQFLVDAFSAGHVRTPRKALYDCSPWTRELSGLLARCMYEEDARYGLQLHNARGQKWSAYGDWRVPSASDKCELAVVNGAVQSSADEVWQAYRTGRVRPHHQLEALQRMPDLSQVNARENGAPLFVVKEGTLQCRSSLTDRQCYEWTPCWSAPATLTGLRALGYLRR